MLNFKNKTVNLEINQLSLINLLIFIIMYNVLKFGVCFGAVLSLAGCSSSEHFMQDDVYNTRTPIMPPGTDLNDVTDYATFVAKKEQTEVPQERTTYVSPRQYYDYFYNTQYVYYGYSPYAPITGLGYYGYSNYYTPYYTMGYGYGYNGFGNPYPYGYSSAYSQYYHPYYGGGYYSPSYYGNTSWYTPKSKPGSTPGNLSSARAGTSAGRIGSSSNGFVAYENKLMAKPNRNIAGAGRNSTVNSSPVLNTGNTGSGRAPSTGISPRQSVRPVVAGRTPMPAERSGTYNRAESNPNSGISNRSTGTSNRTINTETRTSTPTVRSSGSSSSGGRVSSPSSGGGSRSGGRR